MKRVMLVFFDIIEPGGINRVIQGLQSGFAKAGVECDYYHASRTGNLSKVFSDTHAVISSRIFRMAAKGQIGYGKAHLRKAYRKLAKTYDAVMFIHPCPHDNKQTNGDTSWMGLYDVDVPVFVIFHDNFWDRYYKWIEEVRDKISASLFTVWNAKSDSLSRFPGDHYWLPVPLPVEEGGLFEEQKLHRVGWFPQWKHTKGIKPFLGSCHLIDSSVDVKLFNIGVVYYSIRHEPIWQENVSHDFTTNTPANGPKNVTFHGLLVPGQIEEEMRKCKVGVDLFGSKGAVGGQYTCCMLEYMLNGVVPIVSGAMVEHPDSILSVAKVGKRVVVAVDPDSPAKMARVMNKVLANYGDYTQLRQDGLEFVSKRHDEKKIAKALAKMFTKYATKSGQHEEAKFFKLPGMENDD